MSELDRSHSRAGPTADHGDSLRRGPRGFQVHAFDARAEQGEPGVAHGPAGAGRLCGNSKKFQRQNAAHGILH